MKKIFYLFVAVFILSSCSKEEKIITTTQKYEEAIISLKKADYEHSADSFESVALDYEFSEYTVKSLIMSAYSSYKAKNYTNSLRLIKYYFQLYGNNIRDNQYMSYLEILNHFDQVRSSSKQIETAEKVFELAKIFLEKNKNTKFTQDVQNKLIYVKHLIIENQIILTRFYLEKNNFVGALNHLKYITDNFETNIFTPEVFYRYYEIYSYLGDKELMNKYYMLLQNNYKNTEWFKIIEQGKH